MQKIIDEIIQEIEKKTQRLPSPKDRRDIYLALYFYVSEAALTSAEEMLDQPSATDYFKYEQ